MRKITIYFTKNVLFLLFNPLNPPYQGDFKKECVRPNLYRLIVGFRYICLCKRSH